MLEDCGFSLTPYLVKEFFRAVITPKPRENVNIIIEKNNNETAVPNSPVFGAESARSDEASGHVLGRLSVRCLWGGFFGLAGVAMRCGQGTV